MKKLIALLPALAMGFLATGIALGQTGSASIPKITDINGRHVLLVDGKPFFMLGAQAHNSSAWPGMLPNVWSAIEEMHANTLEVPIYWEQIEPQPGKFDFSLIDTMLNQARGHQKHLVLLWFATWKNGSNHYMPEWMKKDAAKYPNITSRTGKPVDSPSPNVKATLDADINAFTAVMRHLKQADNQHTILMVQVENEPGSWGSVRDFSVAAQKQFEAPVPAALLKTEVLKALNHPGATGGSWQKVFGNDADEYFQAWSIAQYIGKVAAAGKAEYPLPLYVNAALRDPLTNPSATSYESGGPTDNVIPIWKAAAPAIDLVAPDIYLSGSEKILKVLELYDRKDNTLFVPEAGFSPDKVKYLYEVLAHGGIGFSPFGLDDNGRGSSPAEITAHLKPFGQEYAALSGMTRELAQWGSEGKIKAAVEREDHTDQIVDLGLWNATIAFGINRGSTTQPNQEPLGKAMFVKLEDNKFLVIGTLCHITFHPTGSDANKAWQYLKVEEGRYENGRFQALRRLNGDETDWGGPSFGASPLVYQISLVTR